jgi:steroid 5-alpha reductase family enzyme
MSLAEVKYDAEWRRSVRSVTRAYACAAAISSALATLLHLRGDHPVLVALCADLLATLIIWGFSLEHNNSSVYDPYWHLLPPVIAAYWMFARAQISPMDTTEHLRCVAIGLVLGSWSLRLTWNWLRGWAGLGHEDWRYASWRAAARRRRIPDACYWLGLSLCGYHLVPTAFVFLAMLPLAVAVAGCGVRGATAGGAIDALALLVGLGGIALQALADDQLRAYRRARADSAPNDPRFASGVADVGVWRFSRHPNYMGELLHWFSYVLFAIGAGAGRDQAPVLAGWLPLLFLFTCVSVPLMEGRQLRAKPAYAEYRRNVSMLVPMPRFNGPAQTEL